MRVAIFGLGYVGTVTAAGLASQGHDVVGVDVERSKVAAICRGESPVVEPGVDRLVAQAVSAGRLRATTEVREAIEGAEVSLVCVGTPSMPRGDTNLGYIARALGDLREAMADVAPPPSGFHAVVIRSHRAPRHRVLGRRTRVQPPSCCPPGGRSARPCAPSSFARAAGSRTSSRRRSWSSGRATTRTRAPARGSSPSSTRRSAHVEVRTAEALKYACNAFHAAKVSFANEMGRVFRTTAWTRARSWRSSARTPSSTSRPAYLRPGFAFGGSCLPKDLRALQHMARVERRRRPAAQPAPRSPTRSSCATRRPGRRSRAPAGGAPRAQLQDGHRRPAGEPQRRAGRAAHRQGLRRAHLRPDHQPERSGRRQPAARRGEAPAPRPAARSHARGGAGGCRGRRRGVLRAHRARGRSWPRARSRSSTCNGRLGPEVEALAGYEGIGW